ncbi:hypothetical protein NC661_08695 [Aquibacillus koreensis]|uniref:Uncharacterized protein n=1 Tax=Aquibacillus koreensis TaxID=279446 RepID=A0A9X4AJL3_9BACI|nr:hypothetical protein [Aquibacillus koreensis]MCT2535987.1 hypothetical protein [Aquibacillus koreensis]MDC3420443.1 hypothetical protein [Aquibacillus koreensis]
MKKTLFFSAVILALITLTLMFYNSGQPIDTIREVRDGITENIEVIDKVKTADGIMIYSVGDANNGNNYMYSVDMIKKSFTGYKWLGGGGHVNQEVPMNNEFDLSLQLLNEEQNINPTIFGVLKDLSVNNIKVSTDNESVDANLYEVKDGEKFYVIPFSKNVANSHHFRVTVTYESGKSGTHIISDNDIISKLQEGQAFYFNSREFK